MITPIRLGVNIDHVATLRQARGTSYPEPVQAALAAELGGADGITLHLREDKRHIQPRDVRLLKEIIQVPMNLEIAVTDAMVEFAKEIKPENVCLVPERREELTTEGGLDVVSNFAQVSKAVDELSAAGIVPSLFIDPDKAQIDAAVKTGAPVIELHTGCYANAVRKADIEHEISRLREAMYHATTSLLVVNAGHGLHYHNVQAIACMEHIYELNIGHAIVARAVFCGFQEAVRQMRQCMQDARHEVRH